MAAAPVCEEKGRLLRAQSFAESDHNRSVRLLHEACGVMLKQDYDVIWAYAEKARELAAQARAVFDRHTAEHGC